MSGGMWERGDRIKVSEGEFKGSIGYLREFLSREASWLVRFGNDVIKIPLGTMKLSPESISVSSLIREPVIAPPEPKCERCNDTGRVRMHVPGGNGDSEDYPCPLCRPPEYMPGYGQPEPGIKRDFEPGGLTGEARTRPSMLAVLEGVTRWAWEGHGNRDTTVKVGGDEVVVRVLSRPTYASFGIAFRRPETVEGTMDTLDYALMRACANPTSSATITFGEELQ